MADQPLKALVVGGASWNTMVYVDAFPAPRPATVMGRGTHSTLGASGAGKALNLRALGVDTSLWALIGDDADGERVSADLTAAGVDLMTQIDPRGTTRHVNLMNADGDRLSIFANPGSDDIVVDVDPIAQRAAASDLVAVTIMGHCRQFLPALREVDTEVWIDLHDYDGVNPHHAEFIAAADHIGVSSIALPDWRRFLEAQVDAGVTTAVCTHGADGASGLTAAEGWVDVAAVPSQVVDTNGAGDGFFAGFAVAWVQGRGLERALTEGAAHASRVVASPYLAPARTVG